MRQDAILELSAAEPKRIGLMGGTFDPVHTRHITLAREAIEQFSLSAVIFLVSGNPPHKQASASPTQRYEMVKLAVADEPGMYVSDIELKRQGRVYTVDTLNELRSIFPHSEFFYIIGADTLKDLSHGWKDIDRVCEMTRFIAFARPGSELDAGAISDKLRLDTAVTQAADVSSTALRHCLTQGLSTGELLHKDVQKYIAENGIYTDECMTFEQVQDSLKASLSQKRFTHTAFVVQTAEVLALKYGADVQRARWAALLHDCAKCMSDEESLALLSNFDVPLSEAELFEPSLLHAPLGALLAREEYGVLDKEVLSAIRLHTVGKRDMTLLEKLVYLADAIEPTRDYPEVNELRKTAFVSLDKAVSDYMDVSIQYVIKKGRVIHPDTVDARNALVIQLNREQS